MPTREYYLDNNKLYRLAYLGLMTSIVELLVIAFASTDNLLMEKFMDLHIKAEFCSSGRTTSSSNGGHGRNFRI
jgi:hypothetical protein